MREIKFRVWNKTLGKFDPAGLPITHNSEKGIFGIDNSYVENFVVQQCTGLKDKNGVEMYEGDILLWEQVWMYPEMDGEIQWVENGYYFVAPEHDVKWLLGKSPQSAKVIGNIFEGVDK